MKDTNSGITPILRPRLSLVLPLASTVIRGAFSRIVLDSNHEVHELPETSQIVNLILKHNLGLIDDKELRVQSKKIKRLQAMDD